VRLDRRRIVPAIAIALAVGLAAGWAARRACAGGEDTGKRPQDVAEEIRDRVRRWAH
jgi:hypothetical protein